MIEVLEDRTVPSTDWYVNATTDTDTGDLATHTGDLRFCINNALSGDDIYFEVGGTIELNSQLTVGQSELGILGSGNTIDGQHNTRLFEISGATTINNLTLTGGNGSGGDGGAILADAGSALSVNQDTFIDNSAVNGGAIAGGVSADLCTFTSNTASLNGGAIANTQSAALTGCTFTSNTAGGSGGAIENTGELTLAADSNHPPQPVYNTFTTNTAVTGGGAIDSSGGGQGQAGIHESNFYGNTAANGGAVSTNDPTDLETDTFGSEAQPNTATASGGNGGAVYALLAPNAMSEQMSVNNSTFAYNQAAGTGSGGAIYTTMSVNGQWGDTFDSNSAPNGGGGAIAAAAAGGGMPGMLPTLTLNGATFKNQTVTAGNGGAIRTTNPATLNNDNFLNNKAINALGVGGSGGAVYSDSGPQNTLQDTGSLYANNVAQGGNGGAIDTSNNATLNLDNFSLNTASFDGGAIANEAGASMTVTGTNFDHNVADQSGGAIKNFDTLKVLASAPGVGYSFTSNTANTNGGAIDSDSVAQGGSLEVDGATFKDNRAATGDGGAINTADPTTLTDDIFGDPNGALPNIALNNGGAVSAASDTKRASTLNVWDSFFYGNQARSAASTGGAIATSLITDIERSQFFNNQAVSGGAIDYLINNTDGPGFNSSLTVNQGYFQGNSPPSRLVGNGGAIASSVAVSAGSVNVSITNSTLFSNGTGAGLIPGTVSFGGGVDIDDNASGTGLISTVLANDTFFQNTASGAGGLGGGLLLTLANSGTGTNDATLTCLTVNQNQAAADGGGVYVGADQQSIVQVGNSIFDGNTVTAAGYNGPVDFQLDSDPRSFFDRGYNLVGTADLMFSLAALDIFNDNPGLANALAPNAAKPGYQVTLALALNSPGYEMGDPSLAGSTDERGWIRQAGKVSIGAEDPDAN
jgi:predicted outer membrane repeat protein